jgi:hypothetical protein
MPVNPAFRRRLEAQGFCGLDDAALDELAPWGASASTTHFCIPSFIHNTVFGRRNRPAVSVRS